MSWAIPSDSRGGQNPVKRLVTCKGPSRKDVHLKTGFFNDRAERGGSLSGVAFGGCRYFLDRTHEPVVRFSPNLQCCLPLALRAFPRVLRELQMNKRLVSKSKTKVCLSASEK